MDSNDPVIELKARPPRIPPLLQCIGAALLVFTMTSGLSWFIYSRAELAMISEIRQSLERTARLTADLVDAEQHQRFDANARNDSAEYRAANAVLEGVAKSDADLAYVYTIVTSGTDYFLVLDTDLPTEASDVMAWTRYEEPAAALKSAFAERRVTSSDQPYTDEYGTFMAAYAPVMAGNTVVAVAGIDLKLQSFMQRLEPLKRAAWAAFLLGTALALSTGLVLWWIHKRNGAMQQLGRQLSNVNAMLGVSRALGSNVGLDNLLPVIVNKTSSMMRADRSSMFIYDKAKQVLLGRVIEGMQAGAEFSIPVGKGIAGRVARTAQPANVPNPYADPDFDQSYDKQSGYRTRAVLAVPILDSKGGVLGVLQALNPTDNHPFDDDDQAMLTALAVQAQVAIERERLNQSANEKRKLEDALRFAQSIQLGMLPTQFPDPKVSGVELYATLIPAKMVGGDFYDFFWLDDDRLGLVMADVSGKGIPAALLMAKAMTLIRAYLGAEGDPADALRRANEELAVDNDSAMFVTVFAAIFNRATNELIYSNAGHNEPYIIRAHQKDRLDTLSDACMVPLGTQIGTLFTTATAPLHAGDVLYLYTDGVNEAMSPRFEEYGDEKLRQLLLQNRDASMAELTDTCIASVRAHAGEAEQSDDITVLVLRVVK